MLTCPHLRTTYTHTGAHSCAHTHFRQQSTRIPQPTDSNTLECSEDVTNAAISQRWLAFPTARFKQETCRRCRVALSTRKQHQHETSLCDMATLYALVQDVRWQAWPHGLRLPYLSTMFFSFSPLNRDHMQWSEEEEDAARKQVEENSATRVAPEEQGKAGLSPCPCRQAFLAYTPADCWDSRFFPCSGTKINEINYVFTLQLVFCSHVAFSGKQTYGWHFKQDVKMQL